MDRLACVEVPAIALQLLLQTHPHWSDKPVAVVADDKPTGEILEVNRQAWDKAIRPGMRYAAGLSLDGELHAATVDAATIEEGIDALLRCLAAFSPEVEPSESQPGVLWLNASGLGLLYPALEDWAAELRGAIRELGLACRIAVGYTRLGTWVAARDRRRGITVFDHPQDEDQALRSARLDTLPLPPDALEKLRKLGIANVGAFLKLPPGGVGRRYGAAAHRLHRMARGSFVTPLQGVQHIEALRECILLDDGETRVSRLLFLIKRGVDNLLRGASMRGSLLSQLHMRLVPERGDELSEALRPAAPTGDGMELANLVHLRLESLKLPSGIIEIHLSCETVAASARQGDLFAAKPKRSAKAAERAFARIRAELGDDAVAQAQLTEGHMPEARYRWVPMTRLPVAKPTSEPRRPMIRRIHGRPIPLPHRPRHEPDGWLLRGHAHGDVQRLSSPQVVSGGWWATPVHRTYHFATMRDGSELWIYFDGKRRRWYLHGAVE